MIWTIVCFCYALLISMLAAFLISFGSSSTPNLNALGVLLFSGIIWIFFNPND